MTQKVLRALCAALLVITPALLAQSQPPPGATAPLTCCRAAVSVGLPVRARSTACCSVRGAVAPGGGCDCASSAGVITNNAAHRARRTFCVMPTFRFGLGGLRYRWKCEVFRKNQLAKTRRREHPLQEEAERQRPGQNQPAPSPHTHGDGSA